MILRSLTIPLGTISIKQCLEESKYTIIGIFQISAMMFTFGIMFLKNNFILKGVLTGMGVE